jgi:tape measure domain-containing protein
MAFLRAMSLGAIIKVGVEGAEELKKLSGQFRMLDEATAKFAGGAAGLAAGAGAFAVFGGLVTAGALALAAAGIQSAAAMEDTGTAFTTMLKGGDEAAQFMDDMEAFAAKTPFNFPQLADAAKRMKAFGFETEAVIPMMTGIGDAVSAMGGNAEVVNRVILAMGQMKAKGKATTQEINQLLETGVFGWNDLAKSIGKSTAETMDLVEKRAISDKQVLDAFMQHSAEAFGGSMDKQSRTFNGLMSNLEDASSKTLRLGFIPLMDAMKPMIALAGGLLGAIGSGMKKSSGGTQDMLTTMERINAAVLAATPAFEAFGGGLMSMLLMVGDGAKAAEMAMEKLAQRLPAGLMGGFGKGIVGVTLAIIAMTPVAAGLAVVFGVVAAAAAAVATVGWIPFAIGAGVVLTLMQYLAMAMVPLALGFALFRRDGESVGDTLSRMAEMGMYFISRFMDPIKAAWPQISASFGVAFDAMSGALDTFLQAIGGGGSMMATAGGNAETLGSVVATLAQWFAYGAQILAIFIEVGAQLLGDFMGPTIRAMMTMHGALSGLTSGVLTLGEAFRLALGGIGDMIFAPIQSQLLALISMLRMTAEGLGATDIATKLQGLHANLRGFTPSAVIAGDATAKLAASALEEEKRMKASATSPDVTANVTVTSKQKVCIDNTLKVDGKNMAIATKSAEVELSDRAGFGVTPWQRRQVLERGATLAGAL